MSNTSDDAFSIEVLSINEKVLVVESASNPSVFPGYVAPIGSLLLNYIDGNLYNKYGSLNTDWNCATIRTGRTIQFFNGSIPANIGTTIIPVSDLLPSITSGSEIWSQSIIPTSNSNLINITTSFSFASSANEMPAVACIFRNNTCISAILIEGAANPDVGRPICFTCTDYPNSEGTSVTYSCRVGKMQGGGVWYINCTQSHSSLFGGVLSADGFQLEEITN
jgi:hypothetical protein